MDGLQAEADEGAFSHTTCPLIVEIGCGSGVASVFLASHLRRTGKTENETEPTVIATDVNPRALQVTKATAAENSGDFSTPLQLEAVQCDLVSALLPRLDRAVDVLIFNPPYVPTPDEEVGSTGIEAAWAGGVQGRRVVDRAIPHIAQILARPHGVGYMITVDDNEPEQLAVAFKELGLNMTPLVRRRAHNEFLTVQKLRWINEKHDTDDGS